MADNSVVLLSLPEEIIENILSLFSYDEISHFRLVSIVVRQVCKNKLMLQLILGANNGTNI